MISIGCAQTELKTDRKKEGNVKKLFTDNRTAGILRMLGTKSGLTVAVMAEQLFVIPA